MTNNGDSEKIMNLETAVSRFVTNGSQLAIGGFTVTRNPMAAIYEIIRQKIRDLHLVCHSNGQGLDILIGAGCVKRVEIAYGGNGRYAPTCICFRRAVERGDIEFEDYSNYQMSLRFLAGALGLPFMSTKSGLGSDILRLEGFSPITRQEPGVARKKYSILQNPFSEKRDEIVLVPALTPDVSLLHVQYAGESGTIRIKGLTFVDVEQAKAAEHVIVTCEKIVPESFLRSDPDQNTLPSFFVDAIVEVPFGAHPTGCFGFYDYDPKHLSLYRRLAREDRSFEKYLEEWVYGVKTHSGYLAKVGEEMLLAIKADSELGYAPGLDRK